MVAEADEFAGEDVYFGFAVGLEVLKEGGFGVGGGGADDVFGPVGDLEGVGDAQGGGDGGGFVHEGAGVLHGLGVLLELAGGGAVDALGLVDADVEDEFSPLGVAHVGGDFVGDVVAGEVVGDGLYAGV